MSSSADFSDEDDYSVKSGSASPAPGDTLPWNLPRHERSKRKIQGGSVLDPAERAVLRIAGKRQSPCCPDSHHIIMYCNEKCVNMLQYAVHNDHIAHGCIYLLWCYSVAPSII